MTMNFIIEGVNEDDGSRTTIAEFETGAESQRWLDGYVRRPDDDGKAGGWRLIEVYDVRGEYAERVAFWSCDEEI